MRTLSLLFLSLFSISTFACPRPWKCEMLELTIPYTTQSEVKFTRADIRAGYIPHEGQFKGNVIYFQGLGDSMLNHDPLFKAIAGAGYRVIAFDYMGQGGSTGMMNKTRIEFIPWIGERVWNKFAFKKDSFPLKTVIGWSTGGLAAYLAASENKVDRVILLVPRITPKKVDAEGMTSEVSSEITRETLTSDIYISRGMNPHRDDIFPNSLASVPSFSDDLLSTAEKIKDRKISGPIKGLVLLAGEDDKYINSARAKKILETNAPHFKIKTYPYALHEIDNERKEIRNLAHRDILSFLNSSR